MPSRFTTLPQMSSSSLIDAIQPVTKEIQRQSMVVCCELSAEHQFKLERHFKLTRFNPDLDGPDFDGQHFDVGFIDCRSKEIRYPLNMSRNKPALTLALVDEHSFLVEPISNGSVFEHFDGLELITESDFDSPILKLRIDSRIAQCTLAKQPQKLPSNNPSLFVNTHELPNNAMEVLQLFLQNTTDWVVIKDINHRFLAVSDRFLKFHGKPLEDIIGKNDLEIGTERELVLGDPQRNWKGYWRLDDEVIDSGRPSFTENLVLHETALEQVREQVAKIPLRNEKGEVYGLFVCVTQAHYAPDNDERVKALSSRRNIEVSPIIGSLASERRKAEANNRQTQSAFNRKNNFIATASHDLRQPMHAIGLLIESLEHQITDKDQRSTLAKMKQSSKDLTDLLNSILDISKLDADAVKVSKSNFYIAPLLKSIEDEFETEAKKKRLNLHVNSTSSIVYTDSLLLIRIFRNLVSNSVKYTQSGNINIITEVDDDSLLVRIKDTGPGIPKEQYQAIFSEYLQLAEQSSQSNFGMGLGLSIVKRLTSLLDINIKLDSEIGHGTCFTLTIPLGNDADNSQEIHAEERKRESLDAYKIMVVEDNPSVLDAMLEMLGKLNCDAYPASNIDEALEIIRELDELPDLLLVDYQLGDGVTGDTAISAICDAASTTIPAVIVTGNTHSDLFRKASESAYRVLNKPVHPDLLLNTVDSAIKEHRASHRTETDMSETAGSEEASSEEASSEAASSEAERSENNTLLST